jgi:ABC-type branched-subunit amino acid transport system substrate-binding protein
MRRSLATVVAVVVLVGGLTVGASTASTPRAANGVSKDEIKVGITYPDLEAIRSVTNTNHGDYEKSYRVVIDDLNEKGGINGRKIVPVFAAINPLGTAPAQEACLKLTEDEKVFAAMSFFNADAPLCFVDSHDTPLLGGQTTSTNLAHAKAPWATLESGAELGPRQIDALVKAGALKGKLGIVAIADEEQSQLKDVVLPALKQHKLSGTTAIIDAPSSDPVANVQQATTIMERFKSDGVKTVLLVGGAVTAVVNALSKSDYRPKLAATNARNLASTASNPATDRDRRRRRFHLQRPRAEEVLRAHREGDRQQDHRERATGRAAIPGVGPDRVRVHEPVHDLGEGRGQEPDGRQLRQGDRQDQDRQRRRLGDDDLRSQDPHLLSADVHLSLRPRSQAARRQTADHLSDRA